MTPTEREAEAALRCLIERALRELRDSPGRIREATLRLDFDAYSRGRIINLLIRLDGDRHLSLNAVMNYRFRDGAIRHCGRDDMRPERMLDWLTTTFLLMCGRRANREQERLDEDARRDREQLAYQLPLDLPGRQQYQMDMAALQQNARAAAQQDLNHLRQMAERMQDARYAQETQRMRNPLYDGGIGQYRPQIAPPPMRPAQRPAVLHQDLIDAIRFGMDRALVEAGVRPSSEAAQRGWQLLLDHLTEQQRRDLETRRFFIVEGCDSGYLYAITRQRSYNIFRLNRKTGQSVENYCFLPQGGLCEGDVLLTQKIALETQEHKALRIANHIPINSANSWMFPSRNPGRTPVPYCVSVDTCF